REPVLHWAKNALRISPNSSNRCSGSSSFAGRRSPSARFEGRLAQALFQSPKDLRICGRVSFNRASDAAPSEGASDWPKQIPTAACHNAATTKCPDRHMTEGGYHKSKV